MKKEKNKVEPKETIKSDESLVKKELTETPEVEEVSEAPEVSEATEVEEKTSEVPVPEVVETEIKTGTLLQEEVPLEKTNKRLLWLGGIVLLITLITTGLIVYGKQRFKEEVITEPEIVEALPTISPSPAVTRISKEELQLKVLNGSGTSGAAKKIADELEDLGYEVVEVGNATSTSGNRVETDLEAQAIQELIDDLEEILGEVEVIMSEDGGPGVVTVILGKD